MSTDEYKSSLTPETVKELTDMLLEFVNFKEVRVCNRILTFVIGLLNTEEEANLKLAWKLTQHIMMGLPENRDPKLLSDFIVSINCWRFHLPTDEKFVLHQLWSPNSLNEEESPIGKTFISLLEEFLRDVGEVRVLTPNLYDEIVKKFESTNSKEHDLGVFVLNTLVKASLKNFNKQTVEESETFSEEHFIACMMAIQHMELRENSSLSLNAEDKNGLAWKRPLYIRLLQLDNSLLQQWTVEYLMRHLTMMEMKHANLLIEFLMATNKAELHDVEAYFLPKEEMTKFIPQDHMKQFVISFAQVSWDDVPLTRWLSAFDAVSLTKPQISEKLFIKLCSRTAVIRSKMLRKQVVNIMFGFGSTINSLSLEDYIAILEKILDKEDLSYFSAMEYLSEKIKTCKDIGKQISQLNKHLYDMVSSNYPHYFDPYVEVLQALKKLPKSSHGWWRLPILFTLHEMKDVLDFYQSEYDINVELLGKCTNYIELQNHLLDKLDCQTEDEISFVHQRSIDVFVTNNIKEWQQINESHLNPIELLEKGSWSTHLHLATLLDGIQEYDKDILQSFVHLWKKSADYKRSTEYLLAYVEKHLPAGEKSKLIIDMILSLDGNTNYETFSSLISNSKSLPRVAIIRGLLYEETPNNNDNIENALECEMRINVHNNRRLKYIQYIAGLPEEEYFELFFDLLSINESLVNNHVAINDGKIHRIQIRIARSIFLSLSWMIVKFKREWMDELWKAMLNPRNPPNVTYLYECLVSERLDSFRILLGKLSNLSTLPASEQVSIISVLHMYCVRRFQNLKMKQLKKLYKLLDEQIPLIDADAKFILHKTIDNFERNRPKLPENFELKAKLESVLLNRNPNIEILSRLMLPHLLQQYFTPSDAILYMTNAPIDEYDSVTRLLKSPIREQIRVAWKSRNDQDIADIQNRILQMPMVYTGMRM